jgi:hypothetical protein
MVAYRINDRYLLQMNATDLLDRDLLDRLYYENAYFSSPPRTMSSPAPAAQ